MITRSQKTHSGHILMPDVRRQNGICSLVTGSLRTDVNTRSEQGLKRRDAVIQESKEAHVID